MENVIRKVSDVRLIQRPSYDFQYFSMTFNKLVIKTSELSHRRDADCSISFSGSIKREHGPEIDLEPSRRSTMKLLK